MGEHSFEVLSSFLGVSAAEYEALVEANVSGGGPPHGPGAAQQEE
jgi:hypothetical protein